MIWLQYRIDHDRSFNKLSTNVHIGAIGENIIAEQQHVLIPHGAPVPISENHSIKYLQFWIDAITINIIDVIEKKL